MQQNLCDGVLSNDWNTLLGQQISQHTATSMSRSDLDYYFFYCNMIVTVIITSFPPSISRSLLTETMFYLYVGIIQLNRSRTRGGSNYNNMQL